MFQERASHWREHPLEIPPFQDNPGVFPVASTNDEAQKLLPLRLDPARGISSGDRHKQHGLLWKMYCSMVPQNPKFARKIAEAVEREIFSNSRSSKDYDDGHLTKAIAVKAQEDVLKILEQKK